ncbi:hypothetical protein KSS87_009560 [Heliosperma pusillum]|nr:hypothetical protein KSS87_009560 [Heliosperma pusillum]
MSSEIKLDIGSNYDNFESSQVGLSNGKDTMSVGVNGTYSTLDDFHQGKNSITEIVSPTELRSSSDSLFNRLLRPNRATQNIISSHVDQDGGKREHGGGKKPSGPLLSGAAYCVSSCSMILLNKVVLSTYNFNAGISLMFYQNLISTVIVVALSICGIVSVEKLSWKLIKVWLPVNIIFVGMLVSGMYSLKFINIAMVTILKNVTNILTAIGEYYLFRRRQNQKVWTAMFLMLTLRMVMDKAKQLTKSGSLNEVSMVLLNNALSLPFAVFLILVFDEWSYVKNADVTTLPMFWAAATLSGLLGLAISFTSMWFLGQTGPTTYSLVGSLNKIPISLAGVLLFNVPLSLPSLFSIFFGLFAGVFFARAKMS